MPTRLSEGPFVRRPDCQKAHLSDSPIVRRPECQKSRLSIVRKYVGKNIPDVHYSESSLFRKFIIPMLGHFSDHWSGGRFRNNSQRADFRTNAAVDY